MIMEWAGIIDSEETMYGLLSEGKIVYVEAYTAYFSAPEDRRDDPLYWQKRIESGEFEVNHKPVAWIEKR